MPLPLLLIVVPPFPIFVAFGWLYARRAQALEDEFRELVEPRRVIALAAILAVTGATVGLGAYGVRFARTTSDLFVASRAVTPWWNAAAISGEYLSAASFLGIAGLQMKIGSGALWLPLGFTAGYLALLLFVAAPLRRFGAYTISDFAEARLPCAHPAARCARRSSRRCAVREPPDRRCSIALYERPGRVRLEESRVVAEAAALVSAMVELSEVEAQGERLARAELRALRAQISPHFIYNALAAVAAFIHSRPEEARELLIEFSEFIRYAFARQRPYVTLADELQYVEKYLRLEQARFGERLRVRVQVDPEVLHAVVPVLSLQPLVENAVRHGVESRPGGRARVDRGASTSAPTSSCACPTTATGSTRSGRPRRWRGADRVSVWATCTGGCRAPSERATASWSRTATGRPS